MTDLAPIPADASIPRDLSWLEFNARVLREGLDARVPLAERMKFLAIFSSNLDEFFKVRVASARQVVNQEVEGDAHAAQTLLDAIAVRAHELAAEHSAGVAALLRELRRHRLRIQLYTSLNAEERAFLRSHFERNILPMLTPLAIEDLDPAPLLPALQLHIALRLQIPRGATAQNPTRAATKLCVVPVPTNLGRWVRLPETGRAQCHVPMEQIIARNADLLFPGCKVLSHAIFRITRDEDVSILAEMENYVQTVARAVSSRRRREAVRVEIESGASPALRRKLCEILNLHETQIYEIPTLLDATCFFALAEDELLRPFRYEEWPPVEPADLVACEDIYEKVAQEDVMLALPYEKFTPLVEFMERAAADPDVLAIKQTLYRTSGNSPIVKALIKAAESGKEVTVLVELRARFDESRNLLWTRQLEDAGCHVIYGIVGLKTHSKALLVIRRERGRIARYVHISTGNYNDKTAKLYTDIGILTCNPEIASDVAAFFNILTGYSEPIGWKQLTVEPVRLKRRFIELIEREVNVSTPENPGHIRIKINSLEDRNVIEALYRASRAGVKIRMNVRGICCLRPGVPGLSENIEVCSIIDRFLEHARIFQFHNGGEPEVYISSSDWMTRNLEHRFEVLLPVLSAKIQHRLTHFLDVFFQDNQKSSRLLPDGSWEKREVEPGETPLRAQEVLYREALKAATRPIQPPVKYIPLMKPESGH